MDLRIRKIDPQLRAQLKFQAAAAQMYLNDYILALLANVVRVKAETMPAKGKK